MNMIEKVARAIAPQAWVNLNTARDNIANASRRKASLKHARAAINAMLEPTEGMISTVDDFTTIDVYQKYIDAALKERP